MSCKLAMVMLCCCVAVPLARAQQQPGKPKLAKHLERFPDQKIQRVYTYYTRRNVVVKHGFDTYYFHNGKPMSRCVYRHGQRNGPGLVFHENGEPSEKGEFEKDRKQGLWTLWYESGAKFREIEFDGGERQGILKQWSESGQLILQQHFEHNLRDGLETAWREDGSKEHETEFVAHKRHGEHREWYANGKPRLVAHYQEDQLHGPTTWWSEDGAQLAQGIFDLGLRRDGSFVVDDDTPGRYFVRQYQAGKMTDEVFYDVGTPYTGLYETWHAPGIRASRCDYVDGRRHGAELLWDEHGNRLQGLDWERGKLNGYCTTWWPGGDKRWSAQYVNGEKHGVELSWDRDGNVIATGENRNDRPWQGSLLVETPDGPIFRSYKDGVPTTLVIEGGGGGDPLFGPENDQAKKPDKQN